MTAPGRSETAVTQALGHTWTSSLSGLSAGSPFSRLTISPRPSGAIHRKRCCMLQQSLIDAGPLTNIDWIDAALCALTAYHLLQGSVRTYGGVEEGTIVVPV
jgi:hypothetical protein